MVQCPEMFELADSCPHCGHGYMPIREQEESDELDELDLEPAASHVGKAGGGL